MHQVEVGSNSLVLPIGSRIWSLNVPILSKVDQKRNWVKLKLVLTLLRITCLADINSYVVIVYASSCEMLTKSEINSNIAQNHFHSSQEVISAHYLHKFI